MDRNDRIKQKYYEKKPSDAKSSYSGNFNPSPYVDLIFERMEEDVEYGEVEPDDFMSNLMNNPKLEIIFGKGSALNTAQKAMVLGHLEERIRLAQNFNPTPYVDKLMEICDTDEFDEFEKLDSDGDTVFDFEDYFKAENFTKEQLALIETEFYERQLGNETAVRKESRLAFFISILFIIIPPFFIPNFLQKMGWLSVDAGWFLKIGLGILSLILMFFLVKKLFLIYVDSMFKSKNNIQ